MFFPCLVRDGGRSENPLMGVKLAIACRLIESCENGTGRIDISLLGALTAPPPPIRRIIDNLVVSSCHRRGGPKPGTELQLITRLYNIDPSLAYHVAYVIASAANETCWQVTRAILTASNWLICGTGPKGYLATLAVEEENGVQDLASEWLGSLLAWYIVSEAIIHLGPDVALAPSLNTNIFYIASIIDMLNQKAEAQDLQGFLIRALRRLRPEKPRAYTLLLPHAACIPQTKTRLLPAELEDALTSPQKLHSYFHKRYGEAYTRLRDIIHEILGREQDLLAQRIVQEGLPNLRLKLNIIAY